MKPAHQPGLSKSTFLMGRQCSKLLWSRYNAKDQIPIPDESQQAVFDQARNSPNWPSSSFPAALRSPPVSSPSAWFRSWTNSNDSPHNHRHP